MAELRTQPLFEANGWKPTEKKLVPTRGPEPKGFAVTTDGRNAGGEKIIVRIKKTRRSVCGLRDTMAKASAKATRFVASNANLDNRLDTPESIIVGSGVHVPNSYRGKGNGKSRSRLLG